MVEHDDVAGDRHDRAHDVFDDDDGEPAFGKIADQGYGLVDFGRVQAGHHLIEQQDAWLCRECPGHFQAALVDGGEILGGGVFPGPKPDELDDLVRLGAGDVVVLVAQEGAGHHVGQHGHLAEGTGDLEGAGQAVGADIVRAQSHEFAAEGFHRT